MMVKMMFLIPLFCFNLSFCQVESNTNFNTSFKLVENQNFSFIEGQGFEIKFWVKNLSDQEQQFIYQVPWIENIKDSNGNEIKRRFDYKIKYNMLDSIERDSYARLKIKSRDSALIYLRPSILELYGNKNLLDYLTISKNEKKNLNLEKLPQFLMPDNYKIKARFYLEIPNNYLEMEVPINVLPANKVYSSQLKIYMESIWEAIKYDIEYDSKGLNPKIDAYSNPFYLALRKDTNSIYAANLLSLILPERTFEPIVNSFPKSKRFKIDLFMTLNKQTKLIEGGESILYLYYILYYTMPSYWGYLIDNTNDFKGVNDHLILMRKKGYPPELIKFYLNRTLNYYRGEIEYLERQLK